MPRMPVYLAIPVAAALVSAGGVRLNAAAAPNSVKATLQKIYDVRVAGAENKNADKLFLDYAPNYIEISPSGKSDDLAQVESSFEKTAPYARSIQGRTQILSVSLKGATATVLIKRHVEGVFVNPNSGEAISGTVDGLSTDTWIKTAAGWRETASRRTDEHDTADGKPFDPSKPPPSPANGT